DELAEVGAQRLLLLSPGDYFAFNQAFAERLDMPLNEKIERVELVSVLAEALAAGRLQFRQADDLPAAFYVDPTHAVRHAERHEAVRSLVSAALEEKPGELFFNRQRAHPTGSTHLQFSNPELARQLTVARLRDAWERGAKTLICDDPGTLYQLQAFAEPYDLRVLSLYELLADHVLLSS
ncbi:MAG: hypothetical protein R3293_18500, partial [Candidatus Promineifilaceae bacterium]|nr:hypothetical protein [Candidatus Promineifilaceae bacterium]